MKLKFPLLLAIALLACVGTSAFGYAFLGETWTKNRTVVMHLSVPDTLGSDGITFEQSCEDALKTWNQYLVHMQFSVVRNSPIDPASGDADNSVFFDDTVFGQAFGSAVGVTLRLRRGTTLTEADVVFNNRFFYDDYRGPLKSGPGNTIYDLHRVALHEFGHVVGLDHPDQDHPNVGYVAPSPPPVAIMNAHVSDIDGAHSLYDAGPPYLNGVPGPNLVNLSTRAFVAPGDNALIGGFIIQGSQPATVVLRAIGHSLRAQGLTQPLTDPVMEIHASDGSMVATNDDWVTDNANAETIASYHLDPSNSRESAVLVTLNPGAYTAVVHGFDNGDGDLSGTGLFELYDLHTNGGRAANLSTRGQVLSDNDVLIGGFIVGGSQPKSVVARAIGPSLASAGVTNALSNPILELHDGSGTTIASNDDWQQSPTAAQVQNAGLAPNDPRESALQATLSGGNYTAVVRGNKSTGIALVELYDLSAAPQ
jgi:hypothetical protein